MTNRRLSCLLVAAGIAACSVGASAWAQSVPGTVSTGVPVYQGTAFVTGVAGCVSSNIPVGDAYVMLYRQLVEPNNTVYGGGIAFATERSSTSYVMPANQPLNAGKQVQTSVNAYGESSKVGPFSYTGGFNLVISPSTLTATTPAVTIKGTVSNFFNNTGCTITIRAALALRP